VVEWIEHATNCYSVLLMRWVTFCLELDNCKIMTCNYWCLETMFQYQINLLTKWDNACLAFCFAFGFPLSHHSALFSSLSNNGQLLLDLLVGHLLLFFSELLVRWGPKPLKHAVLNWRSLKLRSQSLNHVIYDTWWMKTPDYPVRCLFSCDPVWTDFGKFEVILSRFWR
jgi:hypothetical protein